MISNINKPGLGIAIIVLLTAVFGLYAPSRAAIQPIEKPREAHDYRAYGLDCRSCHKSVGLKSSGGTVKPIREICGDCHKLEGMLSHPVDIKPTFTFPPDLPLDENGMMTCATCHNPHRAQMSMFTGKKTKYLRREGSKKEFCIACHNQL